MVDTSVNTDTGERQNPSGWSTDDPGTLAPGGGSLLRKGGDLLKQREQAGKEQESALAKKQEAESPYQQKLKAIYDSPVTAHAELKKLQAAPNPADYKKYTMDFLGAMALVGAFASRKSRNTGNAALKAFTGAMNGWHEGNIEAYAQATKQWEENAKATIQNNSVELQRYQEILNNKALNIEQLKAGLLLAGMEAGNAMMVSQLKAGNIDAALKGIDMLTRVRERLQGAVDPLTNMAGTQKNDLATRITDLNEHPERMANVKYEDFIRLKAAAEAFHGTDPNFPQLKDPGKQAMFAQTGGGGRSGIGRILEDFRQSRLRETGTLPTPEEEADFMAKTTAKVRATGAFATGKQGDAIRSFNVSIDHLAVTDQLIDALKTGNTRALNAMTNELKRQFGSGAVASFEFAKEVVGDEITKSILGTGVGSVTDRTALKKGLDAANSPQALRDVIKTAKRMMAGQLGGYRRQYETSTGGSDDEFNELLSPNARRELGGLVDEGGGGGSAAPELGSVMDGYRFKGGDPSKKENWEQAM